MNDHCFSVHDAPDVRLNVIGELMAVAADVDYNDVLNKPSIAGVELVGDKGLDAFGIASESDVNALGRDLNALATDVSDLENEIFYSDDPMLRKSQIEGYTESVVETHQSVSGLMPLAIPSDAQSLERQTVFGASSQDGTPTVDNPVPIESIGTLNKSALFSVPTSDTDYWYLTEENYTNVGGGWARFSRTSGPSSVNRYMRPNAQDWVIAGRRYVALVEIRNANEAANARSIDFYDSPVAQLTSNSSSVRIRDGLYFFSLAASDDLTGKNLLFSLRFSQAGSTTVEFEMRVSIYHDGYSGNYQPFGTFPIIIGDTTVSVPIKDMELRSVQSVEDALVIDANGIVTIERKTGKIESYAGEAVGDTWLSSTGELSTGATVVYALPNPVNEPLGVVDVPTLPDAATIWQAVTDPVATGSVMWLTDRGRALAGAFATKSDVPAKIDFTSEFLQLNPTFEITTPVCLAYGDVVQLSGYATLSEPQNNINVEMPSEYAPADNTMGLAEAYDVSFNVISVSANTYDGALSIWSMDGSNFSSFVYSYTYIRR